MKTTLEVTGMHCGACAQRLTKAFERVPGVRAAHVSLTPPRAELETTGPVPTEALAQAARAAGGYAVREIDAAAVNGAVAHDVDPPHGADRAQDREPAMTPATAPAMTHPNTNPATSVSDAAARPSLYPLILIVAFIAGTAALTTFVRGGAGSGLRTFMNDFMAGFFLVFSFFKLLDVRGFATTYRTYDVVARAWPVWGFIYPFVELALGVAYLTRFQPVPVNTATLTLMLVGSLGVLRALLRKDAIRCACLGTALNLPMTTVTLVEDLAMALMAAAMLAWAH